MLVRLLASPSTDVRRQAAWALGRVAADGPICREVVLQAGVLPPLLQLLTDCMSDLGDEDSHEDAGEGENETQGSVLLRHGSATLANLCRSMPLVLDDSAVSSQVPSTLVMLIYSKDERVVANACSALSYLSDGDSKQAASLVQGIATPCHPTTLTVSGVEDFALQSSKMGTYTIVEDVIRSDRPVYKCDNADNSFYLYHHPGDGGRNKAAWWVGENYDRANGGLFSIGSPLCPTNVSSWEVYTGNSKPRCRNKPRWSTAYTVSVECGGHADTISRLLELVTHSNSAVALPALQMIGNIVANFATDSQQMRVVLNVLPKLKQLLRRPDETIRTATLGVLSNIITTSGSVQIQAVIDTGVLSLVVHDLAHAAELATRKIALGVIAMVALGGQNDQVKTPHPRAALGREPVKAITAICGLLQELALRAKPQQPLRSLDTASIKQPGAIKMPEDVAVDALQWLDLALHVKQDSDRALLDQAFETNAATSHPDAKLIGHTVDALATMLRCTRPAFFIDAFGAKLKLPNAMAVIESGGLECIKQLRLHNDGAIRAKARSVVRDHFAVERNPAFPTFSQSETPTPTGERRVSPLGGDRVPAEAQSSAFEFNAVAPAQSGGSSFSFPTADGAFQGFVSLPKPVDQLLTTSLESQEPKETPRSDYMVPSPDAKGSIFALPTEASTPALEQTNQSPLEQLRLFSVPNHLRQQVRQAKTGKAEVRSRPRRKGQKRERETDSHYERQTERE